jgi:hypothetical protein
VAIIQPGERNGKSSGGAPPKINVSQNLPRSVGHSDEWLIGDGDGQLGFFADEAVNAAQERASAGYHDAAVHEIARQFGRALL